MMKVFFTYFFITSAFLISSCVPTPGNTEKKSELKVKDKVLDEIDIDNEKAEEETVPEQSQDPSPPMSPATAYEKARSVLDSRCISCHGDSWGIKSNTTEKNWLDNTPGGLIVPGKSDQSLIVAKMLHTPGGNMPPGNDKSSFSVQEYNYIKQWIDSLKTASPTPAPPMPTPTPIPTPPAPTTLFGKAQVVLNNRCLNCHNGFATKWGVLTSSTEQEWLNNSPEGLIVAGRADLSSMVKLMLYSPGGSMPQLATKETFSKQEYDDIANWINSLEEKATEEAPELPDGVPVLTASSQPTLGDRNFVAKSFVDIFGEQQDIKNNIRAKLIFFGGPCPEGQGWLGNKCLLLDKPFNLSGDSVSGSKGYLDSKHYMTVDMATSSASIAPESSPIREGYRTLTCESLIFSGTFQSNYGNPIFNAIKKIKEFQDLSNGRAVSSINLNSYPSANQNYTREELKAAYQLFNNFRTPSTEELDALVAVANAAKNPSMKSVNGFPKRFEPWRYVIYSLCNNPAGQLK